MSDLAVNNAPQEPSRPSVTSRRGFFDTYKPGQGYYARIWSGVAVGVLLSWFVYFVFEKLTLFGTSSTARYIEYGIPTAIFVGIGLLGYWILALNQRVGDFLIATESEMKKVNWTSRKEIIGSTKVVIFVLVTMGLLLFLVDIFFMVFFSGIGILKGEGLFDAIKGLI